MSFPLYRKLCRQVDKVTKYIIKQRYCNDKRNLINVGYSFVLDDDGVLILKAYSFNKGMRKFS